MNDEAWMRRALELAARGRGAVEPNPMVGAVVVQGDTGVGEGWHQRHGGPHAEVHALDAAGEASRGASLYVTLEPCCHHGKTPPCTDAILAAGIRRVVAAMADPFPEVAGRGAALLRQAGVSVEVGLCEADARRLNAPYLKLLGTGRPWVVAKWAMTLDGRIATRSGDSRWISNARSRQVVHELRGRVDAILVGIGTVLADDPQLTARPPGRRTATRIVLDSRLRLPLESRLCRTARQIRTLVVATTLAPPQQRDTLMREGCEVLLLPEELGRPSISAMLNEFGRRRWTNLLVEGGGEVLGSFLDADAIDEVHVFIAPQLMGGTQARAPILGRGAERVTDLVGLSELHAEILDGDIHLFGRR